MSQQISYYGMGGGLDLVTPPIMLKPGVVIGALNYEPVANGNRRIEGHERFDGRTKPSEAGYWQLSFTGGTAAFALGDTVTGATSGATGKALAAGTVTSGSYAGLNAAGYVGLGAVTGTFVNGENLQVAAATRALASGTATADVSTTDADATAWRLQATADARALIAAIPGSGSVRGVWEYGGAIYGFRDNAGATAGGMWKATTAGWVAVALGFTLAFTSGGTTEIVEGNTVTGATSAATAVVKRVVVTSGSFDAGDAAGYFALNSATGTFVAENLNVGASLNVATIAAAPAAVTLPAGGRYDFITHNFGGAASTKRMYGVNGVGKGFEFDGTTFVPITTGMTTDTPTRVAAHKLHLFFAFPNGSLQNSELGKPLEWEVIEGAAEIGMGHEITDLIPANSGVLTVLAANSIANLYGSSTADFQLEVISDEAGALPWTADKVGEPIYMDKRGVRRLSSTQAYGNFNIGVLTQSVKPLLQAYARSGVDPVASVRVRNKDQYRIFFDNMDGLTIYMGKKNPEILPFNLGKLVTCIGSFEMDEGEEIYFGSDDGFVYQLDKGTSFDGSAMSYYLRMPFNHMGGPQQIKRWHKAVIEYEASSDISLRIAGETDYAEASGASLAEQIVSGVGGGAFWDSASWDEFTWSAPVEGQLDVWVDAVGRNMSLLIGGEQANEEAHTIHGLTLFFSVRGLKR